MTVVRRWTVETNVEREHIRLSPCGPIRRVFRKNRSVHEDAFESRYWLGDQGFAAAAGGGRELVLHGARLPSAVELVAPERVGARPLTPFRGDPYGTSAMLASDPFVYASAPARDGRAAFALFPAKPSSLRGVRLSWHHRDTRPSTVTIVARDSNAEEVCRVVVPTPDSPAMTAMFDRPIFASCLDVECDFPDGGSLLLRRADLLWAGDGFVSYLVLDDYRHHRHYHVAEGCPLALGTGGTFIASRHWIRRRPGDIDRTTFAMRLLSGGMHRVMPRIHHVPDGYPSAFIWTEHADNATIDSHRAVCFGRSDIVESSEAIGGFVGHGVPVSKTVFHSNPNQRLVKGLPVPQASIVGDPAFRSLCDALHGLGWDIGLHSPQPDNSSRSANELAFRDIARAYGSKLWIDHSCSMVRNGISALGLMPSQPHFVGDLLARNGFRYCWTFASEDGSELYVSGLSTLQTRFGDWTVTPLMWQHPTETPGLWVWPSSAGSDFSVLSAPELDELIASRGVAVMHAYPAYHPGVGRESFFFRQASSGGLESAAGFESVLQLLTSRRDSGGLLLTTVSRWCSYLESLQDVQVTPAQNAWEIRNKGAVRIHGLTFFAPPEVDTSLPTNRTRVGTDLIHQIDLGPGEVIVLHPRS